GDPEEGAVGHEAHVGGGGEGVGALHGQEGGQPAGGPCGAVARQVGHDRGGGVPGPAVPGDSVVSGGGPARPGGGVPLHRRPEAGQVAEEGGGAGAGPAGGGGGEREDGRGQAAGGQAGQVGLAQPPGAGGPGPVGPAEVVAEDPGPDEGLDVEVDHLARPAEGERLGRDGGGGTAPGQPASPWLGGTSSTHVLPRVSLTSAPVASV